MAIGERTYTFRAPVELGDRIERIRHLLDDSELAADVEHEVARRLHRANSRLALEGRGQSALFRAAIELVLGAAEKVADDLYWAEQYRLDEAEKTDAERAEDDAYRRAMLELTAQRLAQEERDELS